MSQQLPSIEDLLKKSGDDSSAAKEDDQPTGAPAKVKADTDAEPPKGQQLE